jgi:S-adenosyl methyltransferase
MAAGPADWNIARVYDALLGGNHNGEPDQARAAALPSVVAGVIRENRRAVTAMVQRGCGPRGDGGEEMGQVIDLGCGLPVAPAGFLPVHEAAREVNPGATVAYVDNDPFVTLFARWLPGPGTAAVSADLRDPGAVLGDPGLLEVIDLARPVLLLAAAVFHFMSPAEARSVIAGYRERLAPGSLIAVSVGHYRDERIRAEVEEGARACGFRSYSCDEAASLLEGLEVLPPGVRASRIWMARWQEQDAPRAAGCMLCGMGRL